MKGDTKFAKKLESELYELPEFKPAEKLKLLFSPVANYIAKPSTHGGFYFAGVGGGVGAVGFVAYNLYTSLSADAPEILNKLYRWDIIGAAGHTLYLFLKTVFSEIGFYGAGVGWAVGYAGGSIITGRAVDAFRSFIGLKKEVS